MNKPAGSASAAEGQPHVTLCLFNPAACGMPGTSARPCPCVQAGRFCTWPVHQGPRLCGRMCQLLSSLQGWRHHDSVLTQAVACRDPLVSACGGVQMGGLSLASTIFARAQTLHTPRSFTAPKSSHCQVTVDNQSRQPRHCTAALTGRHVGRRGAPTLCHCSGGSPGG